MIEKDELRAWAIQKAMVIPERRKKEANLAAAEKLLLSKEFKESKIVFCYISVRDEVSTLEILKAAIRLKKKLCVPRCLPEYAMEAVTIENINDLENDLYGIPTVKKGGQVIPVSLIDLAVLPCLCADERGYRIGYGKGYYDRFLAEYQGFSVVLCRKELLVDEIPAEPHDRKADLVIAS